jgi:D-beta-D-heptose 7-phosphate kinase/D-beta-D-heptose 1-phosphate adenosyltransferase
LQDIIKRFTGKRLLVVGDVMLDRYLYGTVDRISPEAPVPVVLMDVVREMPGGCGNVARNITALGARAVIAGVVGTDAEGNSLRELLRHDGVDTAGLIKVFNRPTVIKTRVVSGHQQLLRIDRESRDSLDAKLAAEIIAAVEEVGPLFDGIIISDYNKGVVTADLLEAVQGRFYSRGVPVVVDPKPPNVPLIKGIDVLKPNHKELEHIAGRKLTGRADLASFCRILMEEQDYRAVLVTCGREGMVLVERNGVCREIKAEQCEVFDVSGAGDTVCAVLTLCLCAGLPLYDAARVANRAASLVVRKSGTSVVPAVELAACLRVDVSGDNAVP